VEDREMAMLTPNEVAGQQSTQTETTQDDENSNA
jgi:hypothetical protein